MLASRQPKQNLSKNLLEMKFMQKKRDEVLKEEQEKEYRNKVTEEHWYLDNIDEEELKDTAETEPSFVICEDLLPIGRMSFKNFNPSIEKIYLELLHKRDARIRGLNEDISISDEEMAERYASLVNTVSEKFKRKRKKDKNELSDEEEAETRTDLNKKRKKAFLKPKME